MSIINRKKTVVLICVLFACAFGLFAQQITNFGVVDTARVYTTYFRESSAVRNYEAKKSEFQAEIDKKTAELKNMQQMRSLKNCGKIWLHQIRFINCCIKRSDALRKVKATV